MVTHSSTLAWKIPWTEEPGGLQYNQGVVKSRTWLSNFTFTFHFHALEKEMATHSSVLAWKIPGMVEPGGLPSMGSHRVRHDWSDLAAAAATFKGKQNICSFTCHYVFLCLPFRLGRENTCPILCSFLVNLMPVLWLLIITLLFIFLLSCRDW